MLTLDRKSDAYATLNALHIANDGMLGLWPSIVVSKEAHSAPHQYRME